ncbi:hypothetical protein [uncultured Thiodictyon sp.]|uniref:hypothetical protein n=1 Tax=uncultured Thiodictyon sp. TaxID=1846217 RepID=UPI0025E19651|nr:hypothetical protein [uncultured Thiodictyon sp.]
MEFAVRRKYYNRCKSLESLAPEDERNLDIDGFGPHRVRGTNWTDRLGNAIELSDQQG